MSAQSASRKPSGVSAFPLVYIAPSANVRTPCGKGSAVGVDERRRSHQHLRRDLQEQQAHTNHATAAMRKTAMSTVDSNGKNRSAVVFLGSDIGRGLAQLVVASRIL